MKKKHIHIIGQGWNQCNQSTNYDKCWRKRHKTEPCKYPHLNKKTLQQSNRVIQATFVGLAAQIQVHDTDQTGHGSDAGPKNLWKNDMILLMVQKSGVHQLRSVVYPTIYGVFAYIMCRISSTVSELTRDLKSDGFVEIIESLKLYLPTLDKNTLVRLAPVNF